MTRSVLLSFDVEEFDLPKEHGGSITLEEGIKISKSGLLKVLNILNQEHVPATFFCTANFANAEPALIRKLAQSGHEIACHGVDHFHPQPSDIKNSKIALEKITGQKIRGYRQPRMQKTNFTAMKKLGYLYDSSVNPAFIPGRYNNFNIPTRPYQKQGITVIPTSVATPLRIPLFWLALHLFPEKLYHLLAKTSIKKNGYFTTYFHPWEFTNLHQHSSVPKYIQHGSGAKLERKLSRLISTLKKSGYDFQTYSDYLHKSKLR